MTRPLNRVSALVGIALATALVSAIAGPARAAGDLALYAAECTAEITEIPAFDCATGVVIPVTVDGQPPAHYAPQMTCDHPGLLPNGQQSDGQCVPWSRVLDLSRDGMQISAMCRQEKIRTVDSRLFDEVVVTAHNPLTGATCWFQAKPADGTPVRGDAVPAPAAPGAETFWLPPQTVAQGGCTTCHDNDPFMYSPFIAQVWDAVPVNPFGPYRQVGASFGFGPETMEVMAPRDSTCTGCHRIGRHKTCGMLTDIAVGAIIPEGANAQASRFPGSHSMPPGHDLTARAWGVIHDGSVAAIRDCCADPDAPACSLQPITE